MSPSNIFIIGATGYIGGTVFLRLVERKAYNITILVRDEDKARKIQQLNLHAVSIVLGTATDATAIETGIKDADVIIDAFNCDDAEGNATLLSVVRRHFGATKKKLPLIRVSGGGVLMDDARGTYASEKVWDDADTKEMANIRATNPHRPVDLEVLKADAEGFLGSYIIMPSIVFGAIDNVLSRAGIQRENNVVTQVIIAPVVALGGKVVTVGGGFNKSECTHVEDVASLITTVFDNLDTEPHGPEGYYFAESFELDLRSIARIASKYITGDISAEERAMTDDECKTFFPGPLYGIIPVLSGNSRFTATCARRLGWVPKYGLADYESDVMRLAEAMKA
ncbi:NAD(P)-binding protein [Cylindrobasidium torrendii FP15055 ss-10]|uniref:NAD(P)-binding protein n=1 Tax=Cylindrobasidium torrendii FP15055 ss-10 TaxID=1314674 RepID=A0A0D7BS84_9AGAR|nr:NAD(P)-binding protein [Cylindrobasidium torrendii FP15055 ss-10]